MSEIPKFVSGDLVQLKSGGPTMTVRYIVDAKAAEATKLAVGVHVDWFDHEMVAQSAVFHPEQLISRQVLQ